MGDNYYRPIWVGTGVRMVQLSAARAGIIATAILLTGCSVQRYAINTLGDMLASGDSVFVTDDDPVLISEALPFSLKLLESLLAEEPEHRGLLLAASRGYLLYTYAFVHIPAEQASLEDVDRSRDLRSRARRLYLRAHAYSVRALETAYPGIGRMLLEDPDQAVLAVERGSEDDIASLYWTAAALGLAISVSGNEASLLARLPEVQALLSHALEIDDAWNGGALHEFSISLAASRSTAADTAVLEDHYDRALQLSNGNRAGLHIAFAEAVAIPAQDRARFIDLLEQALAVDVNAEPNERLLNLIAQERARWLLGRVDELFL